MFDFTKRDGSNVEHSTIEKIADKGKFNQQKVEDRLRQILDEEYAKGNVTKAIYDATRNAAGEVRGSSAAAPSAQPTAAGARGNSNGSSPPEVGGGLHEEAKGVFQGSEQADNGASPQARPIQVLGQNGQGQGAGTASGIANRYVEADIARGELPQEAIVHGTGWNSKESIERGRALINQGVDAKAVADRIKRTGALGGRFGNRDLSAGDAVSILHAEKDRLSAERRAAQEASFANPRDKNLAATAKAAEQAELKFLREDKPAAGAAAQRAMVAFDDSETHDLSTFDGLYQEGLRLNGNKEMTPAMKADLVRRSAKVQKPLRAEKATLDKIGTELDRVDPKGRGKVPTDEDLQTRIERMHQDLTPCS